MLVYGGVEAFQERLTNRLLDQYPGSRQAYLSAVVVLAGGLRCGGIELGVLEDD